MSHPIKSPRKLIEVALPLDAINAAAKRDKSLRHGHPSTLHSWWAPRPLAATRAVVFAQLVNDPGYQQGQGFKFGTNRKDAARERARLFALIEELVQWENTENPVVLEKAHREIERSWREVCELNSTHPDAAVLFNPDRLPALHDPFAGGGRIPIEAQRLGLEVFATDLNPVPVLINKALVEIPRRFENLPPVSRPSADREPLLQARFQGAAGLADDIDYYGEWIRAEAERRLQGLYPPAHVTPAMAAVRDDLSELVGQRLPVIAWLWARTVKSPNPAFSDIDVPLVASFMLSLKPGQEAHVCPVITGSSYRFEVRLGLPENPAEAALGTKAGGRHGAFLCLMSQTPISFEYIRSEGKAGRLGTRLMAVIAKGPGGRIYLSPTAEDEAVARRAIPQWRPDLPLHGKVAVNVPLYGINTFADLFTPRQLHMLCTLSDLIQEVRQVIREDAVRAGMDTDPTGYEAGGLGATAYAEAVSVYLSFAVDKVAEGSTAHCTWSSLPTKLHVVSTFGRQALPMTWDFAEANVFADSSGNFSRMCELITKVLRKQCSTAAPKGHSQQVDATQLEMDRPRIVSTDPPYYDNIAYADLSDFFYVWLRRNLREQFPRLFATLASPKDGELVATTYRHESAKAADEFFLKGMTKAMHRLAEQSHEAFPTTIYYAFKESQSGDEGDTSSAGWETFLEAVLVAGFTITGTWPVRTEREGGFRNSNQNALASSVVLVCRRRQANAPTISRREFVRELNSVLPAALDEMTRGVDNELLPLAPVDLSQAIIGPGISVFSKYSAILEADGSAMTVRTALQLINRFLAEDDFDPDTQFCLHWFEQSGWKDGPFGDADTLCRAKGTSVNGVRDAGVIFSGGGLVRLLKWSEYATDWDPKSDLRQPVWETLHHLIRALKQGGESGAGRLLSLTKSKAEAARQLAYRLYTLCERKGWAEDARAYNELITSWSGIEAAAGELPPDQGELFA